MVGIAREDQSFFYTKGLSIAALLNLLAIPFIIIEKEDCRTSFWKMWTYDRIKLDLLRLFCSQPGVPHPATSLQGKDITYYQDEYESHLKIHPIYGRTVHSMRFDEEAKHWKIEASNTETEELMTYEARFIIFATGNNSKGLIPDHPGLENFTGEIIHFRNYRNGARYNGQKVLVVGRGSHVMDVTRDLSTFGANPTVAIWNPDGILAYNQDGRYQNIRTYWKGKSGSYRAGMTRGGLHGVTIDALNIANDIKMVYYANQG
uniref:indole-3-pyruvate monooxygenase n=1 Tax=Elaeis guineensis var. tenera TaxID=51953 RepID=A0A6I9QJ22_ELAGV|nr:probable indole-3-pyruvate monooxygenase YUCCA8 [Elaeis guineensis]